MKAHSARALALCSMVVLGGCADEDPLRKGPGVEIAVAPLVLPSIVDVCYGLGVYNALGMTPADLVWTNPNVCSSQYGNGGGGDVAYVGACDADTPAPLDDFNYVRLTLGTIEVLPGQGSLPPGNPLAANILDDQITVGLSLDGDADFNNPCPAPLGCALKFACVENADVRVEFNLTVMIDADQGFFDIAVNFKDIFCSAKYDTCYDTNPDNPAWIELLFGDDANAPPGTPAVDGPGRDRTGVMALACTGGPDGEVPTSGVPPAEGQPDTLLYYSAVTLTCTLPNLVNGASPAAIQTITLPLTLAQGNQSTLPIDWDSNPETPATSLQYGLYYGSELLPCDNLSTAYVERCNKLFLNLAIDLEDIPVPWICQLRAQATAEANNDPVLVGGRIGAPGTVHPFVRYLVPNAGACQKNPLNETGSQVTTIYGSNMLMGSQASLMCQRYNGVGAPTSIAGEVVVADDYATEATARPSPNLFAFGTWPSYLRNLTNPCGGFAGRDLVNFGKLTFTEFVKPGPTNTGVYFNIKSGNFNQGDAYPGFEANVKVKLALVHNGTLPPTVTYILGSATTYESWDNIVTGSSTTPGPGFYHVGPAGTDVLKQAVIGDYLLSEWRVDPLVLPAGYPSGGVAANLVLEFADEPVVVPLGDHLNCTCSLGGESIPWCGLPPVGPGGGVCSPDSGPCTTICTSVVGGSYDPDGPRSCTSSCGLPMVVATTPDDGSSVVGGPVTAVFNQSMFGSTLDGNSFTVHLGDVPVVGTVSFSGVTATFTPNPALTTGTYTARITTAATAVGGATLSADFVWTFAVVPLPPPPLRVFVSSAPYPSTFGLFGGIGGLANADSNCQTLATMSNRSAPGGWKAWLSYQGAGPATRFNTVNTPRPFALFDGTVIADNWADLTDGTLDHPIDMQETGLVLPGGEEHRVWSNTKTDGTPFADQADISAACAGYTSSSPDLTAGAVGHADAIGATWTEDAASPESCDTALLRLYCFEQELDN